jgi:hypothetical protein
MQQGGVQVWQVMQHRRAEDQIKPIGVRERHHVGGEITNVRA